jgi:hypothetical protein
MAAKLFDIFLLEEGQSSFGGDYFNLDVFILSRMDRLGF